MNGLQPYQPALPVGGGAAAHMHGLQPFQPAPPVGGGAAAHGLLPNRPAEPQRDLLARWPAPALMRLLDVDRYQRQELRAMLSQWRQQVACTERQAAATAQAAAVLPPEAAQLLKREGFERQWQQLDAAQRQARAAEQAAWLQLRREQWLELLEGMHEEEVWWKRSVQELEAQWLLMRFDLQNAWETMARLAGAAGGQQAQQAAPANGGQQVVRLPHATMPPPYGSPRQRQPAAGVKRKEPEAAAGGEGEGEGEADESPGPSPASSSTPPQEPSASSPKASLPRRPSAETSPLLPMATLDPADLITIATSSMAARLPPQPAAVPAGQATMGPQQAAQLAQQADAQPPAAQQAQQADAQPPAAQP